jgi:hypothetical protein
VGGCGWIQLVQDLVGPLAVSCDQGNEPDSVEGGEFVDQLSNYPFLKKDSAPWS